MAQPGFFSGPYSLIVSAGTTNDAITGSGQSATLSTSPLSLGVIGEQGIEVSRVVNGQEITGDNLGAGTMQDGVYQGMNMFVSFVMEEIDLDGVKNIVWPWHSALPSADDAHQGRIGQVGSLWSSKASTFLFLGKTGTPAEDDTIHIPAGIIANGEQFQWAWRSGLEAWPIRIRCIPWNISATENRYFTRTFN